MQTPGDLLETLREFARNNSNGYNPVPPRESRIADTASSNVRMEIRNTVISGDKGTMAVRLMNGSWFEKTYPVDKLANFIHDATLKQLFDLGDTDHLLSTHFATSSKYTPDLVEKVAPDRWLVIEHTTTRMDPQDMALGKMVKYGSTLKTICEESKVHITYVVSAINDESIHTGISIPHPCKEFVKRVLKTTRAEINSLKEQGIIQVQITDEQIEADLIYRKIVGDRGWVLPGPQPHNSPLMDERMLRSQLALNEADMRAHCEDQIYGCFSQVVDEMAESQKKNMKVEADHHVNKFVERTQYHVDPDTKERVRTIVERNTKSVVQLPILCTIAPLGDKKVPKFTETRAASSDYVSQWIEAAFDDFIFEDKFEMIKTEDQLLEVAKRASLKSKDFSRESRVSLRVKPRLQSDIRTALAKSGINGKIFGPDK